MSSGLKSQKDKLYVTIAGDGPIGKITVCGNGELSMRGSVDNPFVSLPLKPNGKLDVGGAVGKGRLTVVKSMGLKEPYSGSCQLVSGEIAEDFASYYANSEQQPTAIALGVKIGKDGKCVGAGGVILSALPFAEEKNIEKAENVIKEFADVSTKIENLGVDGIIDKYFKEDITDKINYYQPEYKCLCSKDYVKGILISLGKTELLDIIEKEGLVKVNCQFCDKVYEFSKEEVEEFFK
jgi:molecular chaperone Hsp33